MVTIKNISMFQYKNAFQIQMRYNTLLLIAITFFTIEATAQPSKSFELRYFSEDANANGETDFKGETEIFNTGQRVDFLKHYAVFGKQFFNDSQLNHIVVSDEEAVLAVSNIKPQPVPEFRKHIILDD